VNDQETVDIGLETMLASAGIEKKDFPIDAKLVRNTIQKHKRNLAKELGFDYSNLTDGQLTDSWATGVFPNVQLGLHPEGIFLMRFLPHPYDPERFFYDTITLCRISDHPAYKVPDWMGLPEDLNLSGFSRPMTEYFAPNEPANLGLVLDQDSQLLPKIQKGIKSKGFKGPLWSEQEQRLRHFHCELDLYLKQSK
ncbi:MAG: SRPBCC family protein, partial [Gammaproteobacteria bacterium]